MYIVIVIFHTWTREPARNNSCGTLPKRKFDAPDREGSNKRDIWRTG